MQIFVFSKLFAKSSLAVKKIKKLITLSYLYNKKIMKYINLMDR